MPLSDLRDIVKSGFTCHPHELEGGLTHEMCDREVARHYHLLKLQSGQNALQGKLRTVRTSSTMRA